MHPLDLPWWPETVSVIEAIWMPTTLLPIIFALPAMAHCWRLWRKLRRWDDVRLVAFTFWLICLIIVWKSIDNMVAALPPLFTGAPDDEAVTTAAWLSRTLTPGLLVLNNVLLCTMAWAIRTCITRIARRGVRAREDDSGERRRASDASEEAAT